MAVGRPDPFDDAVERCVERIRDPRLDPVFFGLSSAADHGLLWFALGSLRAARRGDPTIALRLAAVLGVESGLTNGPIKLLFQRIRPPSAPTGPAPLRPAPAADERVPVRARHVRVHRRVAAFRRLTRHFAY